MEPPSPLISWVNPFPSRFINRTACFPRKVSYFRKSRMSRWKNKIGWSRTQKPVLRPFSFSSIFTMLQPLGSGYHEIKVNELPDWDWAWSIGTKAVNWGSRKGYLCECFFFFAVMNPTSKHAPWWAPATVLAAVYLDTGNCSSGAFSSSSSLDVREV